jgi:carboxyl-terminal processing protease
MNKWALALLASLAVSSSAGAQRFVGSPAQDLFDQASFFVEFNYNGFSTANLSELTAKYQNQIDEQCARAGQTCAYAVARSSIANMIRDLQDPHSYFIPASAIQGASDQQDELSSTPSLQLDSAKLRGVGDRVITDVREDGSAGKAGLKRGDRITTVNGQALPGTRSSNENLIPDLEERGEPIRFGIIRGGEKLELTATPSLVSTPWLPEAKAPTGLPAGVSVLRIREFSPFKEVGIRFHELVKAAEKAEALVVDLRDNPGGAATECTSTPGALLEEVTNTLERRYGKTIYRYRDGKLSSGNGQRMTEVYAIPNPAQFKGKVAVLVNADSASCAEVFAAQIQYAKRGVVVGEETYGILNTATSFFDLADGSLLGLTIARSVRPDGQVFPERVKPDVTMDEDLEALANGRDAMLEKALEALGLKAATLDFTQPKLPRELRAIGGL